MSVKRLSKSSHTIMVRQLQLVLLLTVLVILIGTLGYWLIGYYQGHGWHWYDCLYMTLITVTTVGYNEVLDLAHSPGARLYTMVLLVFGCGAMVASFSVATAFFVEGNIRAIFWRRRMQNKIDKLADHIIICGGGSTGENVLQETQKSGRPCLIIERDPARVQELIDEYNPLIYQGDAEDGDVLEAVGIERAAGLITALPEDKDNVYVVITAHALNPKLRIVARGIEPDAERKLIHAGASSVVSPNMIGGLRMASEMIRPRVVGFLDNMLHETGAVIRVEEVEIPSPSPLHQVRLADSRIGEKTGLTVIAIRRAGQAGYDYNPCGTLELHARDTLIVVGDVKQVGKLRDLVAGD